MYKGTENTLLYDSKLKKAVKTAAIVLTTGIFMAGQSVHPHLTVYAQTPSDSHTYMQSLYGAFSHMQSFYDVLSYNDLYTGSIINGKDVVNQERHVPKQYIVAQDGSGDFMSIQDGVDYAADGDTLIIYPGIYTENVEVMNKELNITGIDKDYCILQYDTAFYRKVPLTIAAGTVSNLTIYGMDSKVEQAGPTAEEIAQINAELVGDSWERQKNYSGYAVHVDQNFLYQRQVRFQNCKIVSQNSHCVGIGTRGESSIIMEGCELVSAGSGSCIFLHDPTSTEVGGTAELVMRSCSLRSYFCPYVMTFQSLEPSNGLYLTFQNVQVSAVAYADTASYWANNVNTSLDVELLASLEKTGALYLTGMTSSAVTGLVHMMTTKESHDYMEELEKALDTGDLSALTAIELPEGITYIGAPEEAQDNSSLKTPGVWTKSGKETVQSVNVNPNIKRQVIAVYNYNGLPAVGWCGLNNAYLTPDSYGNTLVEMNPVITTAANLFSLGLSSN